MQRTGIHCIVSGRVQGVAYRAEAKRTAERLGVTGWAVNLPDGTVEVCAFGDPEQLNTLRDWLWEGPPAATVDTVEYNDIPWQEHAGFTAR